MEQVLLFSLTAMANPTLVAATTVMLLLPHPEKLMLGYLLGALITSITLGLVIVFALQNSSAISTAKNTVNPVLDFALGAILLVIAVLLARGGDERIKKRRAERASHKRDKRPPRWQRALDKGDPRITFVVGALLSLPGASYLAALDGIIKLKAGTVATVLVVLLVNVIMLTLLELPVIAYAVAPDSTPAAVARVKRWFAGHAHQIAVIGAATFGALLIIRGLITVLS